MVQSLCAFTLIALLAGGASAHDFLYSGDTPMTHDAKSFVITGSFYYFSADSKFDQEGEKVEYSDDPAIEDAGSSHMWFPVDIRYGITDQLEVGIQPVFAVLDYEETPATPPGSEPDPYDGTGLGDTWFRAKYMFLPVPMLATRIGVKVDSGTEPVRFVNAAGVTDEVGDSGEEAAFAWLDGDDDVATGSGQMDIDGAVLFGTETPKGLFSASVGYRYRMDREHDVKTGVSGQTETIKYTPGNEIHFAAAYTHYISDMMNLTLAADGFFGSSPEWGGKAIEIKQGTEKVTLEGANAVWINPGFEYMMDNGVSLGFDLHYPLMGKNSEALWGLGAFIGWRM